MAKKLLCVLLLAVAAGCSTPPPPAVDHAPGTPLQGDTLTADGTDRYTLAGNHQIAVIAAPTSNRGGNTRIAITTAWQDPTVNHGTCATWTRLDGSAQPGLMLRWDGVRGISVTRNTWAGVHTAVNVHEWDLTKPEGAGRFMSLAGFPLTGLGWPGLPVPLPWRACAWADGPIVSFRVWPVGRLIPAALDPCCGGSVATGLLGAGRPGWYVGHIPTGGVVVMEDLVWSRHP